MTARRRTAWQLEADRRWPDAMDMVEPAYGDGRWATLAWCGPLTVQLHETEELGARAIARINAGGCGHGCWSDHVLVDLAVPEVVFLGAEQARGYQRARHLAGCRTCDYVLDGRGRRAALRRHARRVASALPESIA